MPGDYVDSYYRRTLNEAAARPRLEGRLDCDVCVAGGGLAGLNTALGLARRGRKVVLLERHRVGWGASGRNGGFVSPGFSRRPADLVRIVGRSQAQELFRLTVDAMALIRRRIEQHDIDCGPRQDGIVVAAWRGPKSDMRGHAAFMRETFATRHDYWTAAELRERFQSGCYDDAVFDPDGMHLNALNYARGIARAAEAAGVAIFEGSAMTACDEAGAGLILRTAAGEVHADQAVMAMSGYIANAHRRLAAATLPVATYVMLTEPLGDRLGAAIRAPYGLSDTRFAGDYYRALPDGRVLWGGRVSTFRRPPADLAALMARDMGRIYPQLGPVRAEVAWDGVMGYARHKMPQIGRLGPRLWYCMGFGGKGMCTTTMGGELVARAIADGDETWRLFEPFELGYAGGPLRPAIAQAAYWYYRLRDRLRI